MDYAVTGQVTDGSRGSWVIKCDPLSALPTILGMFNFFFFFHGKLILSVVVSTTDRQASRIAAFLQAKDWPMFKDLKSDTTARNHVCLGRPAGRLQSSGGLFNSDN